MQGIKVIVDNPVPESHQNPDSFEDTLLLLDMVKEKRRKEMKQRKVSCERERERERVVCGVECLYYLWSRQGCSFNIFKSVVVASVCKNRYLS